MTGFVEEARIEGGVGVGEIVPGDGGASREKDPERRPAPAPPRIAPSRVKEPPGARTSRNPASALGADTSRVAPDATVTLPDEEARVMLPPPVCRSTSR